MTTYDFGEKAKENYKTKDGWTDVEVWQTPKYLISKKKAIELIESKSYGLDEGDFWILKNMGGKKLCYTGLIISHNGCLKINDKQEEPLKFKPLSASIYKDNGNGLVVMSYINQEQGIYEFGEVSPSNCKNDYVYAMVLKRLMDRVILKNSKIGFHGIYSEAESDDFKRSDDEEPKKKNPLIGLAKAADEDMADTLRQKNEEQFDVVKLAIMGLGSVSELEAAWKAKSKEINALEKYAPSLYEELRVIAKREKQKLTEE